MKVSEYLQSETTKGIFPLVVALSPDAYKKVFGDADASLVDGIVSRLYGERELIPSFTSESVETIIGGICLVWSESWVRRADAFNAEYDLLATTTSSTEKTIEEKDEEQGTGNSKVSTTTFNDSNFVDDEKTDRLSTGSRTGSKKETVSEKGIKGGGTVSEIVSKEMTLRKQSLQKDVIADVMSELILSIY